MRGDRPLCALDVAAKVVIFKIDVDIAGKATVFTFDLGRTVADGDVRQPTQRNVRAVRGSDTAGHQRFQRITISARVTQVAGKALARSEEHTSELQSLMRTSYVVVRLKKKHHPTSTTHCHTHITNQSNPHPTTSPSHINLLT